MNLKGTVRNAGREAGAYHDCIVNCNFVNAAGFRWPEPFQRETVVAASAILIGLNDCLVSWTRFVSFISMSVNRRDFVCIEIRIIQKTLKIVDGETITRVHPAINGRIRNSKKMLGCTETGTLYIVILPTRSEVPQTSAPLIPPASAMRRQIRVPIDYSHRDSRA